jgi:hypothetical protein
LEGLSALVTSEVLAFDWGTTIVGVLDIAHNVYTPYRSSKEMINGTKRIASAEIIVSFGGTYRDLTELSRMLSLTCEKELSIHGHHDDMSEIISEIRWPPDPGTARILGQSLCETYRHYFGAELAIPPAHIEDEYEVSNWRDCHMTAELWKKWRRGDLGP